MLRYSLIPALLSTAALAVPIEHGSALLARGLSINPNKPASDTLQNDPWPTGELNWCLQDVSQEETFLDLWSDAYTLWDNAWGDSSPTLRVPVYGGACSDQVNVNLVLAITITNTQSAATTVGYNNAIGGSNTMSIDTSNTWGYFDSAVNLAHEMGHAWGLLHEHQKWAAWNPDTVSNPPRPDPLIKYTCENLADYDKFAGDGLNMTTLCSSQINARLQGFSASELLPINVPANPSYDQNLLQSADFDWDSIMLYPSTAGGKIVNGVRQNVLVKNDGTAIAPNLKPSAGDVTQLKQIYGPVTFVYDPPTK